MSALNAESSSVQSYLSILQDVISRMATNSASCKTWCITIVSAILVLILNNSKLEFLYVALIPVLLFLFLDAYYLCLERLFRDRYNQFITKLHEEQVQIEDVYILAPPNESTGIALGTFKSIFSFSILPFYGILIAMIFTIKCFL